MSRGAAAVVLVVLVVLVACTTERPTCYAGEYVGCACDGGAHGYAICRPEIDGYGPCVCDGAAPGLDAGRRDALSDAGADATRGFLEPCATNEECVTGLCAGVPGQSRMVCSKPCTAGTAAADCPPPSVGCNAQGRCAPP
jgi:hypothetical protein